MGLATVCSRSVRARPTHFVPTSTPISLLYSATISLLFHPHQAAVSKILSAACLVYNVFCGALVHKFPHLCEDYAPAALLWSSSLQKHQNHVIRSGMWDQHPSSFLVLFPELLQPMVLSVPLAHPFSWQPAGLNLSWYT